MQFDLREMDFGMILDRGLKLFKDNFVPLIIIMALFYGPFLFAINYVQETFTKSVQESSTISTIVDQFLKGETPNFDNINFEDFFAKDMPLPLMGISLGLAFVLLMLSPLSYISIFHVLAEYIQGRTASVGAAISYAAKRYWTLMGALVLVSLVFAGGICAISIPMCLTPFMGCLSMPAVFVAALLAGIYMAILPCVVTFEDVGSSRSMSRTWELLRGFWWRSLGIYLLVSIIISAVTGVFTVIGSLFGALMPDTISIFFNSAVSTLFSVIFQPIMWAVIFLMYIDLRIRKENFDLQLLAQRTFSPGKLTGGKTPSKENKDDAWS